MVHGYNNVIPLEKKYCQRWSMKKMYIQNIDLRKGEKKRWKLIGIFCSNYRNVAKRTCLANWQTKWEEIYPKRIPIGGDLRVRNKFETRIHIYEGALEELFFNSENSLALAKFKVFYYACAKYSPAVNLLPFSRIRPFVHW